MKLLNYIVIFFLGIGIGVGATMALNAHSPQENVSDWLTFLGAMIGVIATIIGTLFIESVRASATERRHRRALLRNMQSLESHLNSVQADPIGDTLEDRKANQLAKELALSEQFEKFVYARHFVPHEDIDAWHSVEALQTAINREQGLLNKEREIISQETTERVLEVHASKVFEALERLKPHLQLAIQKTKVGV